MGNTHISQHQAATAPSLGPGLPKLCRAAGNHRPLPMHPTSGGLAQGTRALNGSPAFSCLSAKSAGTKPQAYRRGGRVGDWGKPGLWVKSLLFCKADEWTVRLHEPGQGHVALPALLWGRGCRGSCRPRARARGGSRGTTFSTCRRHETLSASSRVAGTAALLRKGFHSREERRKRAGRLAWVKGPLQLPCAKGALF